MSDEQHRQGEVRFDSADIGKKKKPVYFTEKTKTKNPIKDLITDAFKGKKAIISIALIIVFISAIIVSVLWLVVWRDIDADVVSERTWKEELVDMTNETYHIYNSNSETAFTDALNFIDNKIAEAADSDQSFDLRMTRASFLILNGGASLAISDMLMFEEDLLSDEQRHELYLNLAFAYRKSDNESSARIYDSKINELPKSVTTKGE